MAKASKKSSRVERVGETAFRESVGERREATDNERGENGAATNRDAILVPPFPRSVINGKPSLVMA